MAPPVRVLGPVAPSLSHKFRTWTVIIITLQPFPRFADTITLLIVCDCYHQQLVSGFSSQWVRRCLGWHKSWYYVTWSHDMCQCNIVISLFVMIVTFNNCDQHLVIIHLLVMPIMVVMCATVAALWWLLHCYKPWLGPVSSTFNSYITLIVITNHHKCVSSQ